MGNIVAGILSALAIGGGVALILGTGPDRTGLFTLGILLAVAGVVGFVLVLR